MSVAKAVNVASFAPSPSGGGGGGAPSLGSSRVFETLLARLAATADDRIRNISAATLVLAALMKAVKAARHEAPGSIPTQRIVQRLCYFASARDTSVRSDTFRIIRHLVVDRETALLVIRERVVLCVARSLDREPKFMWERVQALKVARALLDHAPDLAPLAVIRALLAIATFSATSSSQQPPQRGAGGEPGAGAAAPIAMGRRPAPGMLAEGGGGGAFTEDPSAAAVEHDPLRRVALDTLRSACLSPALLPRLSSAGVIATLSASIADLAVTPQVGILNGLRVVLIAVTTAPSPSCTCGRMPTLRHPCC